MLDNIFLPLFDVSIDPSSNPPLHHFLSLVVGFDCVDDESKHERGRDTDDVPPPAKWNSPHSPPYYYWVYYLHANIVSLNMLRAARGFSTFSFRPHAGEAGDVDHVSVSQHPDRASRVAEPASPHTHNAILCVNVCMCVWLGSLARPACPSPCSCACSWRRPS